MASVGSEREALAQGESEHSGSASTTGREHDGASAAALRQGQATADPHQVASPDPSHDPSPDPSHALPSPGHTAGTPPPTRQAPPPTSRAGSLIRTVLIVLVILAAVAAAIWKIHANRSAQTDQAQRMAAAADRPIPVSVTPVQQRTMPIYLTALGTVTAYNTVTLHSRVDGQLLRVTVREGQSVTKGQLLAEIDPRPYQAALEQAQGQLVRDQANSKNAEAEANRYTALFNAGVVSRESQQAQVSTAGQASGSIQADQAAINAARVNLVYTRITSPIDGVVGLRQIDPGNIVHAADTNGLLIITQLQPISVIFTLPEDNLPRVLPMLRSGRRLVVEAYDRGDTAHLGTGSVLTVDNQIDTTTGTDKVKAVFPNSDHALFPNQFVNVRLILENRANSIVVPSAAVQTGSEGSFVYIVHDGNPPAALEQAHAASRNGGKGRKLENGGEAGSAPQTNQPPHYVTAQTVKIDTTEGTSVIIDEGLKAGDQIVVDGQEKLRNGSRVIPHAAHPSPGTGNPVATGNPAPATGPESNGSTPPATTRRREPSLDAAHPDRRHGADPNNSNKSTPATGQSSGEGSHP